MHLPSEWWRAKLKTEGGELPLRRRFGLNPKSRVPLHSYEKRLEILTGLPAWNEDRWSKFVSCTTRYIQGSTCENDGRNRTVCEDRETVAGG